MTDGTARAKWGKALDTEGFQIIPNLLLTHQGHLGLSPTEIVVLLHLHKYWWTRDQNPYPSPTLIAEQMDLHPRSVERCLKRLEAKGMIQNLEPIEISGRMVRPVSLVPLTKALNKIAERLEGEQRQGRSAKKGRGNEPTSTALLANDTSSTEMSF